MELRDVQVKVSEIWVKAGKLFDDLILIVREIVNGLGIQISIFLINQNVRYRAHFNLQLLSKLSMRLTFAGTQIPVLEATMTSFLTTADPAYLFDGNYYTCAHSEMIAPFQAKSHENGFIFSIKLTYTVDISVIRIVNRIDCCDDRTIGFKVYIINEKGGEVDCGTISEARRKYELRCRGVGNEVQIRKEGRVEVVNLNEVEVFGSSKCH